MFIRLSRPPSGRLPEPSGWPWAGQTGLRPALVPLGAVLALGWGIGSRPSRSVRPWWRGRGRFTLPGDRSTETLPGRTSRKGGFSLSGCPSRQTEGLGRGRGSLSATPRARHRGARLGAPPPAPRALLGCTLTGVLTRGLLALLVTPSPSFCDAACRRSVTLSAVVLVSPPPRPVGAVGASVGASKDRWAGGRLPVHGSGSVRRTPELTDALRA